MCEPVETAHSFDYDTHAVATRPQERESTDCAVVCGVLCRWADCPTHRQVLQRGRGQSMNVKLQHLANQEASFLSETASVER